MKVKEWFNREYADWCYGTDMAEDRCCNPNWDGRITPQNRLRFLWEMIPVWTRYGVGSLLCRWRGHGKHLKFDSDVGPDSGSESWWCERCGISGSHTYY